MFGTNDELLSSPHAMHFTKVPIRSIYTDSTKVSSEETQPA